MGGCGPAKVAPVGTANVVVTSPATVGSGTIGAAGGTVMSPTGAGRLVSPPGAVTNDTQVQVVPSALVPPAGLNPVLAACDFLPADLTFAVPATLVLPLPEGTTEAVVYLLRADGSGWDLIGGASWEGSVKATVTRLGTAFASEVK